MVARLTSYHAGLMTSWCERSENKRLVPRSQVRSMRKEKKSLKLSRIDWLDSSRKGSLCLLRSVNTFYLSKRKFYISSDFIWTLKKVKYSRNLTNALRQSMNFAASDTNCILLSSLLGLVDRSLRYHQWVTPSETICSWTAAAQQMTAVSKRHLPWQRVSMNMYLLLRVTSRDCLWKPSSRLYRV